MRTPVGKVAEDSQERGQHGRVLLAGGLVDAKAGVKTLHVVGGGAAPPGDGQQAAGQDARAAPPHRRAATDADGRPAKRDGDDDGRADLKSRDSSHAHPYASGPFRT